MQKPIIGLLWQTAMRYPWRTSLAMVGSIASTVIGQFVGPYIISELLNAIQAGTVSLAGSWSLIALYTATQIYGQIIGWRLNLFFIWTMETAAQRDLYRKIFTSLTQQSLSFHSDRFGGALVSQTSKLIGAFERFWDTAIFSVLPSLVSIIAATVILSFVFWQYAAFLFGLSIVYAVAVFFGSKFLAVRNKEEAQALTATNGYVADVVTNVMTVKSYGNEAAELEELTQKATNWREKSLSTMRGFLGVSSGYSALVTILNVIALVGALWAAEQHLASIGTVFLCITYTFTVARQLWEMNSIMRNYNRIIGDAHDMTEILALDPQVVDKTDTPITVTKGHVAFQDVTFAHDGNDEQLFDAFNLDIKPGERIGLVGPSGSGKTTLTRLLLRFSDVDSGSIAIDNQNISEVTQDSLRRSVAYVPQEPMLFHRTLRENIAYGKPDATEEQVIEAAKQANALDFIEKLPERFDTMVGERGVKLSGGQRQRIAIARAILKDAPILVLDEATSALDSESERLIQDALEKLMKNRTSIVIAHRLSTIAKLDRIIVLENGRITEQGSHQKLLEQNGTYAKLWAHQSGGFIEE
ncbi:ABC transporter ATP-binding protein [Streptomyces caniscabiei]|uniref:ABC transporter ATP-binding protein n=1 Tax=Streptomyces caniscabiei TaxID=2746961 RepID=UPI0029A99EAE|nr:ABC transporter ATP-binding protein [Streptomyces caniscabiei]MDX2775745.1 ABC transporter ATP-binding protein [Streptomyces caniscabiei]